MPRGKGSLSQAQKNAMYEARVLRSSAAYTAGYRKGRKGGMKAFFARNPGVWQNAPKKKRAYIRKGPMSPMMRMGALEMARASRARKSNAARTAGWKPGQKGFTQAAINGGWRPSRSYKRQPRMGVGVQYVMPGSIAQGYTIGPYNAAAGGGGGGGFSTNFATGLNEINMSKRPNIDTTTSNSMAGFKRVRYPPGYMGPRELNELSF